MPIPNPNLQQLNMETTLNLRTVIQEAIVEFSHAPAGEDFLERRGNIAEQLEICWQNLENGTLKKALEPVIAEMQASGNDRRIGLEYIVAGMESHIPIALQEILDKMMS